MRSCSKSSMISMCVLISNSVRTREWALRREEDCLDETDKWANDVHDRKEIFCFSHINAYSQVGLFPLHRLQKELRRRVRLFQCPLAIGFLVWENHTMCWMMAETDIGSIRENSANPISDQIFSIHFWSLNRFRLWAFLLKPWHPLSSTSASKTTGTLNDTQSELESRDQRVQQKTQQRQSPPRPPIFSRLVMPSLVSPCLSLRKIRP